MKRRTSEPKPKVIWSLDATESQYGPLRVVDLAPDRLTGAHFMRVEVQRKDALGRPAWTQVREEEREKVLSYILYRALRHDK